MSSSLPHPFHIAGAPLRWLAVVSLCWAAAPAQSTFAGPYFSESFEAHRYQLGVLGGMDYLSSVNGQDGWLLFDSIALTPNWNASTIQDTVVHTGAQAAKFDAALMTPGCFGELRRNALFSLTTGVIESEMDFLLTSSSNPSAFWEFYTQPAPNPGSCQLRWFIAADGHVEFLSTVNHTLIVTSHYVSRNVWHHARTVVDVFGNHTEIHIDGTLVGAGQPMAAFPGFGEHGFSQIDCESAGNDAFYFDNFTVRERTAAHGLSLDLPRLPQNQRSVVGFNLFAGPSLAGRYYALLATLSGTSPGTPLGSVVLPLNADGFTGIIATNLGTAALPGFYGQFNADGDASATFDTMIPVPAGLLGLHVDFAYVTLYPFDAVSEAVRTTVTVN